MARWQPSYAQRDVLRLIEALRQGLTGTSLIVLGRHRRRSLVALERRGLVKVEQWVVDGQLDLAEVRLT